MTFIEIAVLTLLSLIAGVEITRLILTHSKQSKKGHFKAKLQGVEQMIWDLQFKVFKTREIREDVRKEYDRMVSRIATLDAQITNFPEDKDVGEKKRLEDQKVLAERDRDRFQAQLKQLDLEVEGSRPTNEYPDGVAGVNSQIESLRELKGMLKDWLKRI